MTSDHPADLHPSPPASARERLRALRRRERAALSSDPPPVEPRGGTTAPTSRAQQALWFVEQLAGPGSAYNTVLAVRLRGALELDALRDAWRALVERQAALRTCLRSSCRSKACRRPTATRRRCGARSPHTRRHPSTSSAARFPGRRSSRWRPTTTCSRWSSTTSWSTAGRAT
jgi:hypothetical protein